MRILVVLLCVTYLRAHFLPPGVFPYNHIPPYFPIDTTPHINNDPITSAVHHPSLITPDDGLQHHPNIMPYWAYPQITENVPHNPPGIGQLHPYYPPGDHNDFVYPHEFVQSNVYRDVRPSESHNVPVIHESLEESDHQEGHHNLVSLPYKPLYDVKRDHTPPYLENLMAAENLAADLDYDTHIEGPTSMLDPKLHYNAFLAVLLALAEGTHNPLYTDFDAYYENGYLPAIEEHYTKALLDPNIVSQKVEYYTNVFEEKIRRIKDVIESSCKQTNQNIASCDYIVDYLVSVTPRLPHEAMVLQALADVSDAYEQMSEKWWNVSEQYIELAYLLQNKEVLKDIVKKLYYVMEVTSPATQMSPQLQHSCKDMQVATHTAIEAMA